MSPAFPQLTNVASSVLLFQVSVVLLLVYVGYQRYGSPLRNVPGPFLASVTPLWRLYRVLKGNWHLEIIELHQRYGEWVRIAPNEVSSISPSLVQTAYSHSGAAWPKADWYRTWYVPEGAGSQGFFSVISVSEHRALRRRVSKAYSMSYLLAMEQFIDPLITSFASSMTQLAGTAVDMGEWAPYFAFDAMGELAFGKNFGYLEKGRDWNGMLDAVYTFMTCTAAEGFVWTKAAASDWKVVRWVLNRSFLKTTGRRIEGNPNRRFEKIAASSLTMHSAPDRHDLLYHFKNTKNADGSPMAAQDVFNESFNVIAAGADTTAISIRAVLRFVYASPRVLQKLREEIDGATKEGLLSKQVQYSEALISLPYFLAVVKEVLRLFPAVGYQLPRVVPEGGILIDGVFLPGGSIAGLNAWALHQNPQIYGVDAASFRPERWLEHAKDSPVLKAMEACYATFGFGSRTCVGRNIAMMEIYKLLPTIIRDFDVEICDVERPWTVVTAWFTYQSKFLVRVYPRVGT